VEARLHPNMPLMLYGKQRNAAIRWDITTVDALLNLKAPRPHRLLTNKWVAFCDLQCYEEPRKSLDQALIRTIPKNPYHLINMYWF